MCGTGQSLSVCDCVRVYVIASVRLSSYKKRVRHSRKPHHLSLCATLGAPLPICPIIRRFHIAKSLY